MWLILISNPHAVIYIILLSKTIDILHAINLLMLKIYEVLIFI